MIKEIYKHKVDYFYFINEIKDKQFIFISIDNSLLV